MSTTDAGGHVPAVTPPLRRRALATPGAARVLCALGLVIAAAPRPAVAQELPVVRLSLEQAQLRALRASHRLAEMRARQAAAGAVADARAAADMPILSLLGGYQRTNHVLEFTVPTPGGAPRVLYPDVPDNYRTRLDLQWPIYSGGRADALERAARAEQAAVAADVVVAQADLRLEVARAFWALVTARATVTVLEESLVRAQANVGDVRQRLAAGLVPPNEVASAEAQASHQRVLAIEARTQRDVTAADLARLTGIEPGTPVEPDAALDGQGGGLQVAGLVAEALATRGERTAMTRRIDAAREQRTAAAAGRRPTVSIAAGADYARPNPRIFPRVNRWDDSWDAGVNVGWSLWDGGRVAADVAQAAALEEAARARLAEFDSVLSVDVRQRALEVESGRAAVAAADDAVRAATEARRVVDERYRAGVIAQIEVLDAEVALLQAQLDRTRSLAGVRLAEARLERAVGR